MTLYATDFGAVGDGVTMSSDAINAAITKANELGGGYVSVPAGDYLCGTIELKSNVYLRLEPGCTILASMNKNDLNHPRGFAQIIGHKIENAGVIGEGVINLRRDKIGYTKEAGRPDTIVIQDSRRITIRDISVVRAGGFVIFIVATENVVVDHVMIDSTDCENGDGIDFGGSRNVVISNCVLKTGDDAIGLKTYNKNFPCENFVITNCVISSRWAAIRIGPECGGDYRNITVSNCVFNDCSDGLKIQVCDDVVFEDFTFSNINMNNIKRPFFITSNSYNMCGSKKSRVDCGVMKHILIDNVIAGIIKTPHDWFENQLVICGMLDGMIDDIMISNLYVHAVGGHGPTDMRSEEFPEFINHTDRYPDVLWKYPDYPSACFYIKNARRIRMMNCVFETVKPDGRPAIVAACVDGLKINQASTRGPAELLAHHRVNNLSVVNCDGGVRPFDEEHAKAFDEYREYSIGVLKDTIAHSLVMDEMSLFRNRTEYPCDKKDDTEMSCTVPACNERVFLSVPRIEGSVKILINNREIFSWDRIRGYTHATPIAVDVTGMLTEEKNHITVIAKALFTDKIVLCRK